MKFKEQEIVGLIDKAIAIFDTKKAYTGIDGLFAEHFDPLFFIGCQAAYEKKQLKMELKARLLYETSQFNKTMESFCRKYNIDRQDFENKCQKSSDFYLAMVMELLKKFERNQDYRFIFMGIYCDPEAFSGAIEPLQHTGNLLIVLGLSIFFLMMPAILFTLPLSSPIIAGILCITVAVTLFLTYCGAMIRENQMPFTSDDPTNSCTITQLFGNFINIESTEYLGSEEHESDKDIIFS